MASKELMIEGRASFVQLDEAKRFVGANGVPSGDPRWGITVLVPYDSPMDKTIRAALREISIAQWKEDGVAEMEAIMANPQRCAYTDGKLKPKYAGYKDHFALSCYRYVRDGRPIVMDNDTSPIYKPDGTLYDGKGGRIYGGVFVKAKVQLFTSKTAGKGLRCQLAVVQRWKHGDAFGAGAAPTADGFGEITEGADAEDDMS